MSHDDERVQVWRWRIVPPGPPLTATLPVMEAIKGAVAHVRFRRGAGPFPARFHGGAGTGHTHGYWLPEDEDEDGSIDHVIVFALSGIEDMVTDFALVTWFLLGDQRFVLKPSWMGPRPEGGMFGPAVSWVAMTPYVTPWRTLYDNGKPRPIPPSSFLHRDQFPTLSDTDKPREELILEAQLLKEINSVERIPILPRPVRAPEWRSATMCGQDLLLASQFVTESREKDGPHKGAIASFPRVTFPEPVVGPLAFGYRAHFGLGLLMPEA
jgi:CRISPR-associated protein Csb2